MRKKIITICGGYSSEREISIMSGVAIAKGIFKAGYESFLIDTAYPAKVYLVDEKFEYNSPEENITKTSKKMIKLIEEIKKINPYRLFNGLHGGEGENGQIQALFELMDISYTGSNSESSAISMNKNISKIIVADSKIPTAHWQIINKSEKNDITTDELKRIIKEKFGYPVVVKAIAQGSSVGVEILQNEGDIEKTISMIKQIDDDFMIEQYISGRELSIPIVKGETFPAVEIIPKHGFYDYENKYKDGMTDHICPAKLSKTELSKLEKYAAQSYKALGCKDYARIDFILDSKTGEIYFLEANTLPGMTKLSLLPESAAAKGIDFEQLLTKIIEE